MLKLFNKKSGPPDAAAVAERAGALKFVTVFAMMAPPRHMLSEWMEKWSKAERDDFTESSAADRDEFVQKLGRVRRSLSPSERDFFKATAATMSLRQQIDASWRAESLFVMAWALRARDELPGYGQQIDLETLADFPGEDREAFAASARLRPAQEIQRARDIAELWHWRSRTRGLMEDGDALKPTADMQARGIRGYEDIVRLTSERAAEQGDIRAIDGDFMVLGRPYRDLSDDEWSSVRSISQERHFALNWLCGYSKANEWDETPTDT
jgi:hypothetical protein